MLIYTIYKVTNKINGKVYIGFDSRYPKRKRDHKFWYEKEDYKFYRALRKYGWNSFIWEPIYQSKDKEHTLKMMEPYFILEHDSFHNGYNSTLGGDGTIGYKHTDKTKEKMRAASSTRRERIRPPNEYDSRRSTYRITFPNGNTEIVDNLPVFCKKHNVDCSAMSRGRGKGFLCVKLVDRYARSVVLP